MKYLTAGLLFGALCAGSWAADGMHTFTTTQDRVIELKVITCDFEHDKVLVERQDGHRVRVNISDFCDSDRAYLHQWFMANALLSDSSLKIDCDDKVTDRRKETVTMMQASPSGNLLKEVEIGEKRFENIAYEITFANNTAEPIENARVEYMIYYEQTERGIDQDPAKKTCRGAADLAPLAPRSKIMLMTEAVEIYNDNITAQNVITLDANGNSSGGALEPGEGQVRGIRGRLFVMLSSGETIVREFHHPSSLSEKKYPWQET